MLSVISVFKARVLPRWYPLGATYVRVVACVITPVLIRAQKPYRQTRAWCLRMGSRPSLVIHRRSGVLPENDLTRHGGPLVG